MFELEKILVYANSNMQIIGIFIAIIGGLVATKLLNTSIEKDVLKEKINKIEKEITFYTEQKKEKEYRIYLIKREDYINYIYDKVHLNGFDIKDYDDCGLTEEERKKIILEISDMISKALRIFEESHKKKDVERILKENHIQENTVEYKIYKHVGYKTGQTNNNTYGFLDVEAPDISDMLGNIEVTSFQENMLQRDLNNNLDEIDEVIKWKIIEKGDIETKIIALKNNLEVKNDVNLFILITVFAIIVPQLILTTYPIFKAFSWLKYFFAIYSILTFIISMTFMLMYIWGLLKNTISDLDR